MHDLLEGWILSCRIAGLTVMVEDDSQVILVFAGELFEVELVGIVCEIFIGIFIVL